MHSRWQNASTLQSLGSEAEQGVFQSLEDFLANHAGASLHDLLGSWGVDPVTSDTGLGHAWAIVAGSGIFAVDPSLGPADTMAAVATPEPATWSLLLVAAAVSFLVGLRRRSARQLPNHQ